METLDLPLIWALVIALAVFLYVILDGFDLGVGILFPVSGSPANRDTMMRSIAPVWDGNETWLALAGISLFAAFPKAFAAFMPSVYLPVTIMVVALVARGVAVEFRGRSTARARRRWDRVFAAGSLVAAVSQGFALGAFIQGTRLAGTRFAGGFLDWLSPFTVLVAVGVVAGYALLGATWLNLKTGGELAARARSWAARLTLVVVAAMVVVGLCVLGLDDQPGMRWGIIWPLIDLERLLPLMPVPVGVAVLALWLRRALDAGRDNAPFYCALGLFTLGFAGLAISLFPYVVPYRLTIWDAAAAPNAQAVLLLGILVLLPLVITYTGYVYWIFRGKVSEAAASFAAEEMGHEA